MSLLCFYFASWVLLSVRVWVGCASASCSSVFVGFAARVVFGHRRLSEPTRPSRGVRCQCLCGVPQHGQWVSVCVCGFFLYRVACSVINLKLCTSYVRACLGPKPSVRPCLSHTGAQLTLDLHHSQLYC